MSASATPTVLDPTVLAQIVAAVAQIIPMTQAAAPPPHVHVDRGIKWTEMPHFPAKCDRIDAWFLTLETLLKASRIPQDRWAEKFLECPKVGAELKSRISVLHETLDYPTIRRHCLDVYGPCNPVGYFRSAMYHVKGTTREDVMPKLEDALALHNRASRDEGRPEWTEWDVIYPFLDAFPAEASSRLKQELSLAMKSDHPFRELVARAPSQDDKGSDLPLIAAVGNGEKETGSRKRRNSPADVNTQVLAAIRDLTATIAKGRASDSRTPQGDNKRQRGTCNGCGGACTNRSLCPAQGKQCHNCGGMNHYVRVCRSAPKDQGNYNNDGPRPFSGANATLPTRPFQWRPRSADGK